MFKSSRNIFGKEKCSIVLFVEKIFECREGFRSFIELFRRKMIIGCFVGFFLVELDTDVQRDVIARVPFVLSLDTLVQLNASTQVTDQNATLFAAVVTTAILSVNPSGPVFGETDLVLYTRIPTPLRLGTPVRLFVLNWKTFFGFRLSQNERKAQNKRGKTRYRYKLLAQMMFELPLPRISESKPCKLGS